MFGLNLLSLIVGIVLGVIFDQTFTRIGKWIYGKIKDAFGGNEEPEPTEPEPKEEVK